MEDVILEMGKVAQYRSIEYCLISYRPLLKQKECKSNVIILPPVDVIISSNRTLVTSTIAASEDEQITFYSYFTTINGGSYSTVSSLDHHYIDLP